MTSTSRSESEPDPSHQPADRRLVILKVGSTFDSLREEEGDFEDWIAGGLKVAPSVLHIVDARRPDSLPPSSKICGVVITGSHDMVTEGPDWLPRVTDWLRSIAEEEIAILGICFGHQMLATAFGGSVGWLPMGRQLGTQRVTLLRAAETDPLFSALPHEFPAHGCHAQVVVALPAGAIPLARTEVDPHHAFRYRRHVWGVQFHPEFSLHGMQSYIAHYRHELTESGSEAERLVASVEPSPASAILEKFARSTLTALGGR